MLSIIVPVLNEADGVAATLPALAPLRARGAEVIVIDGGSGDGTAQLAASHADRVLHAPRGRAAQMNAGAAAACGEILLFMHADTLLPESADALIVNGLQQARRGWGRFDVATAGRHPLIDLLDRLRNLRSRVTGIASGDQGIFVTRSLFTAAGGYPETAPREDLELSKQLRRFGPPLCLKHRLTVSRRR